MGAFVSNCLPKVCFRTSFRTFWNHFELNNCGSYLSIGVWKDFTKNVERSRSCWLIGQKMRLMIMMTFPFSFSYKVIFSNYFPRISKVMFTHTVYASVFCISVHFLKPTLVEQQDIEMRETQAKAVCVNAPLLITLCWEQLPSAKTY